MERTERLSTSVTEETKQRFRIRAAQKGMNMSEYLRELVLQDIDDGDEEGNANQAKMAQTAD
ncbi:plasmid mobilization protein [Halorarum salinum]|uniref:Ribbon-helix-helix protein, copG family n=1 Tax=Halorarum salinum TaxID=2743089 RepID=A0A7D5LC53_9EURY|nr:hypothetical protein [Halobaculum salinum]QLG63051.1 hypothetical protein HUG12_15450 [Halobaculum salinum]